MDSTRVAACGIAIALAACQTGEARKVDAPASSPPPSNRHVERGPSSAPAVEASPPGSDAAPLAAPVAPPFDFHGWCADRGIEAELSVDGCEPARLGDKPDDTLWCWRHDDASDLVVVYLRTLYVVRAKKLVKLIEVPFAAGPFNLPRAARSEDDAYSVKLNVRRADDGKSMTLIDDDGPRDCNHALDYFSGREDMTADSAAKFRAAIQKVCAVRSRYTWDAGTLRKAAGK